MTNLLLGPRKQQSANDFTNSKTISKRQRCSESSSRRLWIMAESITARTKVLEQLDQDCSQGERPRSVPSPNASIPRKEDANRSLYKILEAALTRISVLEKKRGISYCCAFKASTTGTECIIRGCGGVLSAQHTARHLRTTFTPEHQVASIITQQTECLECNKSWKTPFGVVHHEATVHGEAYTSRMEIFRPIFEQTSCMFLALIIRQMLANQLKARWMEIVQRSHHIPNHTMSFQPLHLPILLLQIPHRHPTPKSTISHRPLSTAPSRTGLNQTISTPLRTLCLQMRHRSPHLSVNPNHQPTTRSRNGLNPMISKPLQTPHP